MTHITNNGHCKRATSDDETCHVHCPLSSFPPQAGERANESLREFHVNPTILIVDDTPSNLGVVVSLFENRGYRVAIAQDGEEGMQRAQLVQPDLILLDVMMPGVDGFEICRRLKAQPVTRDIPVIFMTALASSEHKIKGFQSGAVDYVTKPLQIDEIMARVDTHLKLHAAQTRLEEQNAQLDKHREELELRVAERTAELTAREREFRTLAESLPDNLARYDTQCRIIYMNRNLESLLGKKLAQRRGMTPVESAPGPFYVEYQARLAETIATGQPREIELVFPDSVAGVHYHHIRFVAERDVNGEIVGALAIGRDITERKRAERELHLLNSAVNASSEAAFLMNAQGRFVYVNEEACRSLGYSREELLTMSPTDIDPDMSAEIFAGLMESLFVNGTVNSPMESRHRARDGHTFPIEIAASPLKLEDGYYCLTMVRDISARKQAERLLHEREQAIRAVVENSPDAYARYDRQFCRIYVNPAAQRLLGLPLEQILGKAPVAGAVLPPEFTNLLESVFQSGEELRIELPFRWANGERGWGDVRIVPEFGPDGQVVTVLSIGRDITERKRVEEELIKHRERLEELVHERTAALEESKARLRALIDNLPFEVWAMDTSLHYTMQNTASVKNSGTLVGRHIEDLGLPPEVATQWVGRDQKVLAGEIVHGEYEKNMGGTKRTFDSLVAPVILGEEVVGIVGVGIEITERKRAEEQIHRLNAELEQRVRERTTQLEAMNRELSENEQRYREIFDNAIESMYLLEVTADGRFRNIDVNPALAASAGIPREAMIGRFVEDTVPEEVGQVVVEKYRRCVATGKTIVEETWLDLPAGKRYYYSTITPIYHSGRIYRLIGISRDVTELKEAERELEESRAQLRGLTAQREAAREEERKYIAREVHDELGQILTGLKLNISVLNHMYAAESQPLREHLQETMMLTDRSLEVARNVASALRPAALDMGIVSALEWLTSRYGSNTGIKCELCIAGDDLQLEENRAIALFRIVQESLTNVARYAKADKMLVTLGKDAANDYVLKVRDNGVGFDINAIKSGTFGLIGIRERALMLGGTANIISRPGEGTEIVVRIPARNISEEL